MRSSVTIDGGASRSTRAFAAEPSAASVTVKPSFSRMKRSRNAIWSSSSITIAVRFEASLPAMFISGRDSVQRRDCNTHGILYDAAGARPSSCPRGEMMALSKHAVQDRDVYSLTNAGEAQIRGASTTLPAFALELLVRIDGRSSVAQIAAGMPEVPSPDVADAFELLMRNGLIAGARRVDDGMIEFEGPSTLSAPLVPSAAALSSAAREVGTGVSSLQREGF